MTSNQKMSRWGVLLSALILVGMWAGGASAQGSGGHQEHVQMCHVPPGNPDVAHTIRVSQTAATHHLHKHPGDSLGECFEAECVHGGDECDDGNACTSDYCLDGVCVNVDSSAACDDGNVCTADSCVPACVPETEFTVFVTEGTFLGVHLDGLAGLDAACQAEADAAGLPGTYVAWLSQPTPLVVNAAGRLDNGTFVLVDGTKIADDGAGLTSGTLLNPINLTATGAPVDPATSDRVLTGTAPNGKFLAASGGGTSCAGWGSGSIAFGELVIHGNAENPGSGWTTQGEIDCLTQPGPLYCFEIDPCEEGCNNEPTAEGQSCDDGNRCTNADTCRVGQCIADEIEDCCLDAADCNDGGNQCTADICCTDVSTEDECRGRRPNTCVFPEIDPCDSPPDLCHVGMCDPLTGSCEYTPVVCGEGEECNLDTGSCEAVTCPCWDGSPDSAGSSLNQIWFDSPIHTCTHSDYCEDHETAGAVSASVAECQAGDEIFFTAAQQDLRGDSLTCSVFSSDGIDVLHGNLSDAVYAKCLADHDAFTLTTEFGDPPDETCGLPRQLTSRVFLTDTAGARPNGLWGADETCESLGSAAGLSHHWTAWISDSTVDARDRISPVGHYQRWWDAAPIAIDLADLTDGSIDNPINIDQNGATVPPTASVWTGTVSDGTVASNTCLDWTSTVSGDLAQEGRANETGPNWTGNDFAINCADVARLYCFELPLCGNGTLEAGEECDDGNDVRDDGCNAQCNVCIESNSPTVCTQDSDCCDNTCNAGTCET